MEFNAFNGTNIQNLKIEGETVRFDVDVLDRTANIEITGVKSIQPFTLPEISDLANKTIENIDIEVTDITDSTFTKVVVTTSDNQTITLLGDMKGTILNMEDFNDLIGESDED